MDKGGGVDECQSTVLSLANKKGCLPVALFGTLVVRLSSTNSQPVSQPCEFRLTRRKVSSRVNIVSPVLSSRG